MIVTHLVIFLSTILNLDEKKHKLLSVSLNTLISDYFHHHDCKDLLPHKQAKGLPILVHFRCRRLTHPINFHKSIRRGKIKVPPAPSGLRRTEMLSNGGNVALEDNLRGKMAFETNVGCCLREDEN